MKKILLETMSSNSILLDTTNEACSPFGFLHGEIAMHPDGETKVIIQGVYPGHDGVNKLWYEIDRPKTKGRVCYWGGAENLLEAGFKKVKKIVVLFSGSASSLRYLSENDKNYGKNYEVICGISNKKETKGEIFCKEKGIPFIQFNTKNFCLKNGYEGKLCDMPASLRIEYFKEMLNLIGPLRPDLIILSGFMLEITKPLLGYCPIINVHPADLTIKGKDKKPKYTGDDAVRLAIEDGQRYTASTIHFVEKEVDCGRIICISESLAVEKGIDPSEHQEKMKVMCDGPAYREALRILCMP